MERTEGDLGALSEVFLLMHEVHPPQEAAVHRQLQLLQQEIDSLHTKVS